MKGEVGVQAMARFFNKKSITKKKENKPPSGEV